LAGLDWRHNRDFMAKWRRTKNRVQFTSSNSEMTWTFKHFWPAFGPCGVEWVRRFLGTAFPDWAFPSHSCSDLEVRLWPARLGNRRFAPSRARQGQLTRYVLDVREDAVSHLSGHGREDALKNLPVKLAANCKVWEGDTEPDVVIRLARNLLVLIEAKRYSPIETHTRYDSARNQVIRNLDIAFAMARRAGIDRAAVVVVGPSTRDGCCLWDLVHRYRGDPVAVKHDLLLRGPRDDVSDQLAAFMARSLGALSWDEVAALSAMPRIPR